jgi:UDP-3-O-[3-hydroxymyristoyl] glucosamine N-acyltransferase
MESTLKDIAESVQAKLIGDGAIRVEGIASIKTASANDLVFIEDAENLDAALNSAAAAVIAGEFANGTAAKKPLLICSQPRLAFARAAKILFPAAAHEAKIHASASVSSTAKLGKSVSIDAGAVLSDGAEVGDNTHVGANNFIGTNVTIGSDCNLYSNVTIYAGARLGNRVIIHAGAVLGSDGFGYVRDKTTGRYEKFPQVGKLEIEDDVEIGANTTIDRGALAVTRIARGVKIDNLVHIGHNVSIGEDVVIAAQTGFSGSITVEKNAVIGGQVGIGEQATIGEGVMLGGQSGVLPKKVLRGKGIAFWGTPAKPVREYLKELAVLGKLARKSKE